MSGLSYRVVHPADRVVEGRFRRTETPVMLGRMFAAWDSTPIEGDRYATRFAAQCRLHRHDVAFDHDGNGAIRLACGNDDGFAIPADDIDVGMSV